jgi:hypothetical protein
MERQTKLVAKFVRAAPKAAIVALVLTISCGLTARTITLSNSDWWDSNDTSGAGECVRSRPLPGPFYNVENLAWTIALPPLLEFTDKDETSPRLILCEDGVPLGPNRSSKQEIKELGAGRYAHIRNMLWFSTLDGSDANENGRKYSIRIEQPR